ncbi:MAG: hypothetical protein D3926_05195 [Desulfobacteraceae bacterium]|nr:MAG: hypothetical protein D3926_05195 [Desulfobacteraceae bacterium]
MPASKSKIAWIASFIVYFLVMHAILIGSLSDWNIIGRIRNGLGIKNSELTSYYHTLLAFHLRIDPVLRQNTLVFIGDSLIQGLCVTCVADRSVNYGIGRDTTFGVLNRIRQYRSLNHARAVILSIGINDVAIRTDDEIIHNYNDIIRMIPGGVHVIANSILPVDEKECSLSARNNERIGGLNQKILSLTREYPNCFFLNLTSELVDESANLKAEYHIGDGVHLNTVGNLVWIKAIRKKLEQVEK